MSDLVILTMNGPRDLLRQLHNGSVRHLEQAPLMRMNDDDEVEPAVSIHVAVLQMMLESGDDGEFLAFRECMDRVLELDLLDDHESLADATRIFFTHAWDDDASYVGGVLNQFIARGFIDVNKAIPGDLDSSGCPDDQRSLCGLMPMAAAICAGNGAGFKILHEAGADWSLGSVVRGGAPRMAGELALELANVGATQGATEVLAYTTEILMTKRIEADLSISEASSQPRAPRRAPI